MPVKMRDDQSLDVEGRRVWAWFLGWILDE